MIWRCLSRLESGTRKYAESPSIEESLLQNAVMKVIEQIAAGNGDFVGAFRQNVIRVIGNYGKTEEKNEYDEWFDKHYKAIVDEITIQFKSGIVMNRPT